MNEINDVLQLAYNSRNGWFRLNIRLDIWLDSTQLNLASIHLFYDSTLAWLRLQSFGIRLDNEPRVKTRFAEIWSTLFVRFTATIFVKSADVFHFRLRFHRSFRFMNLTITLFFWNRFSDCDKFRLNNNSILLNSVYIGSIIIQSYSIQFISSCH